MFGCVGIHGHIGGGWWRHHGATADANVAAARHGREDLIGNGWGEGDAIHGGCGCAVGIVCVVVGGGGRRIGLNNVGFGGGSSFLSHGLQTAGAKMCFYCSLEVSCLCWLGLTAGLVCFNSLTL